MQGAMEDMRGDYLISYCVYHHKCVLQSGGIWTISWGDDADDGV